MPGINGKVFDMHPVFLERRQRVIDTIHPGAMILFAAPVQLRNNDVEQEYRQDSDLYYLLGFEEPECVLVIVSAPTPHTIVFLRERDASRETWDGPRLGVEAAATQLGVDEAISIQALTDKLPELLADVESLYFAWGADIGHDQLIQGALRKLRANVRKGGSWPTQIIEPGSVLHEMRLHKDEYEIAAIRRAIQITEQAHRAVFRAAQPFVWEYELEAILRAQFRHRGSARVAYGPIVASGINATVLHHKSNDRQSMPGELILVDAGCEFDYQSADITRTFPVQGRFTPLQRHAYDVVLSAQAHAIDAIRPGSTVESIHDLTVRVLVEGLLSLGIVHGEVDEIIESGSYKKYYMHRTSHWLGMDVHDVGRYHTAGKPRPLEPGMVLTVEPGLYFPAQDDAVPEGLRATGIRIEDNLLVTESGHLNLSSDIPKLPEDIEDIMQHAREATVQ